MYIYIYTYIYLYTRISIHIYIYVYCELGSGSLHQHLQHLVPQALQRFQGCHAFCTTKRKCRPQQMSQHPVLGFQAHQRSLWLSCTTRPPLLTNAPWARCLKWLNTSDANLDVKWLKAVEGFMTMWKRKQIKCAYSQYIYILHIYIHNYTYTYTIVYMLMIKSVAGLGETQVMRGRGWRRAQPTASNTPKVNPETTRVWCFFEARLKHPKISIDFPYFYGWYKDV